MKPGPSRATVAFCALLSALVSASCGAPGAETVPPPRPASPSLAAPPPVAVAPEASSPVVAEGTVDPGAASDPTKIPEVDLGPFTLELGEPVTSIALGEKRHAALGADAWLSGKEHLEKIALPGGLRPERPGSARIFFGRDDLPRIMGTRLDGGSSAQLYARYRDGRWLAEKNEVGRLLQAPPKSLRWGVLGHADPEVACKQDDVCIIKRLTGWKTMPAGAGTPLVELQGGVAWALHANKLVKLDKDERWVEAGGPAPFTAATGFAVVGDELWISEATLGRLHRFTSGAWTTAPSPVREPRGLWAASPTDVWLAAGEALAHFDGKSWSRVKGVRGPVAEVRARGKEIWVGGESGVWSHRPH